MKTSARKYKYIREWRKRNSEKCRAYCKNYASRKESKHLRNRRNAMIKTQALRKYGGRCETCGAEDCDVLSIDHVNNDGAEHRRNGGQHGNNLYRILLREKPKCSFQVLCVNCQWRKRLWGSDEGAWLNMQEMNIFLSKKLGGSDPDYPKQYNLRIKHALMGKYGNVCKQCGCNDLSVLTIHHINSDGAVDRKMGPRGQGFYRVLLRSALRPDLQILCFNCQFKKEKERLRCLKAGI